MKNIFKTLLMLVFAASMSACGFHTIETGQVGVVKTWAGKTLPEELHQDWYFRPLQHIDTYTVKDNCLVAEDLKPTDSNTLRMKDVDVTVCYSVNPETVADFAAEQAGMSARLEKEDFFRPGYIMMKNLVAGAVASEVAKYDSLVIGSKREELEGKIKDEILKSAPKKYGFSVSRVTVTSLLPDDSIQDSIRRNVAKTNELAAAQKEVEVKERLGAANDALAKSLSPAILQHEYISTLRACAESKGCTMLIGVDKPMVNIGK